MYSIEDVRKGLLEFKEHSQEKSNRWSSRLNGKKTLLRLFNHGKSKKGGT